MGKVFLLIWMLVAALSGKAQAQADDFGQSGNRSLKEAQILYDNLQYRDALNSLKAALRVKKNSRRDIAEIYRYMGSIYIIQGQKKNATRAFRLLLKVDPDHEMNPLLTSPKILTFFNKVKEAVLKKERVIMRHSPLAEVAAAERLEIRAYVVDLHQRLKNVRVYYRKRGTPTYSIVQMKTAKKTGKGKGTSTYIGFIPFVWQVTDEVELFVDYYIAGIDAKGRWVANVGTPKQPQNFRINLMAGTVPEGSRSTPLLKQWWFWTLVGVGAAGIAAGSYFIIDSSGSTPLAPGGEAVLIIR